MGEKTIESKLRQQTIQRGGLCLKFISPSLDGVPDRIILLPKGKMAFAELKAPSKKMRPLQRTRKRQFERLGFKVYCIDGIEMMGGILDEIQSS